MGRVAARELAGAGADVIIVDWEGEAGTRLRDELNAARPGSAEFAYCDVSSFASVRELVSGLQGRIPSIDVLVNNAGITDPVRRVSPDGYEMHLATCHLGHFLLTHLLLDELRANAGARVITVSSEAHKSGSGVDFEDLNNESIWGGRSVSSSAAFSAYHRAKLMNLYFTFELARRAEAEQITVNALSPGYFVNTDIYRNMRGLIMSGAKLVFGTGALLGLNTPEKGARTHVYLATSPEVAGVTGKYFQACREHPPSELALDRELAQRVWDWSVAVTGVGQ
jgi:NAD(P)-dependent dehydrogenase (short-subunit alcohol dehydrogenase family)